MFQIIKSILLIICTLCPTLIFSQADPILNQKIYQKDSVFIKDSIRARELHNIVGLNLYRSGLYSQALDTFLQSLALKKKIFGEKHFDLASSYNAIGLMLNNLGHKNQAIQYFQLAEKSYLLENDYSIQQIINLYINLGIVYREKLDFSKALQYYKQALNLYKENFEINSADLAYYSYPIAEIYYQTNEYEKALKIINDNIENSYPEDQISYYKMLAYINLIQGGYANAQKNYQKFTDLIISIYGNNSIELADAYVQYAAFLISNNQFSEAHNLLNKAYAIIESSQPDISIIRQEYYKQKGYYWTYLPVSSGNVEIFQQQKIQHLNRAIDFFEQALNALNFPENYTIDNPNLENLLSLIEAIKIQKLIADNYSEIADLELLETENIFPKALQSSIETYKIVSSLIQRARKELTTDDSKIQLTSLEYETFYKMIKTTYTAYKVSNDKKYIDLAFQNAERVKSSSVYDNISDQMAMENSGIPDSLLHKENQINNRITEISEKLFIESTKTSPDSSLIKQYSNEKFDAMRDKEALIAQLESEYGEYYQLKYANTMSSINDIQEKLNQDQVILEYVLNETDSINELYTFLISKEAISFNQQNLSTNFINDIETMFGFVSNDNYLFTNNDDSKNYCISSFQIYKTLVEPYKNELKDKNITIIPDGKLSYIPFDALISSLPDTTQTIMFNQLDYLIKSYNINYSNSANLLFQNERNKSFGKINVLAFAPEYNGETFELGNKEMTLVPLVGVKKEVQKIAEFVKSKVFIDEDANEENFRNNAEKYDILHLAMHAFINDSLPAFSSLAFYQNETETTKSDGLLSTADIYNLKLNAKLTVLSACNTGTGKLQKGEGILSLARGFLYAGCPSIIMSLWEVDDESGTQIMSSFYKNLKKGKTKDEALKSAKLEYLETAGSRKAHPHYWLSFVSIGDNSSLYMSYDYYFFILLVLAFVGIAVDQLIRIKKARKKQAL